MTPDGKYEDAARSLSFPLLPPAVIETFVARRNTGTDTAQILEFQTWVRANVASSS